MRGRAAVVMRWATGRVAGNTRPHPSPGGVSPATGGAFGFPVPQSGPCARVAVRGAYAGVGLVGVVSEGWVWVGVGSVGLVGCRVYCGGCQPGFSYGGVCTYRLRSGWMGSPAPLTTGGRHRQAVHLLRAPDRVGGDLLAGRCGRGESRPRPGGPRPGWGRPEVCGPAGVVCSVDVDAVGEPGYGRHDRVAGTVEG